MKILIVDDDPNILAAFRRALRGKLDLTTVQDGHHALELIAGGEVFAVVVSDYQMPHLNGIDLLSQIGVMAPDAMRIMLTGEADMQVAVDAINKGNIYRFLLKPCPMEQFLNVVNDAIEQYRLRIQNRQNMRQELLQAFYLKNLQGTFNVINNLLEKKEPYTAEHQRRVGQLANAIAVEMGLGSKVVECVRISANVHDIGKIYIPSEILNKSGKISDLEFILIQSHSQAGYEIIKEIELPCPVAEIILQHHERCDGSGYPNGLKAGEIHLEAKIISVADVVEAMASHRPYRPALGLEAALDEIRSNRDRLYDSRVADACVTLLTEKDFRWK